MANTNKYLDYEGLKTLWSQIESNFVDTAELNSSISNFFTKEDVALSYDNGSIKLVVNGADRGTIDASPFIKDGMLDDVSIKTVVETVEEGSESTQIAVSIVGENYGAVVGDKVVEFVWNVDGGTKTDYILTKDIAVDPETSNTKLSESITVAGGPLADLWLNAGLGNTIDTTTYTTMQDLLKALFCVEKWSEISTSDGTPKVSVATTFNLSKNNAAVVEYGTSVTITTLSAKQTNTTATASISGFDYGYYSLDGSTKTEGTSVSKSWVYTGEGTETAALTGYVGFGLSAIPAQSDTLTVGIGTNSLTATSTGVAKTATCEQVGPVYDVSNLGNIANNEKYIYTIEAQTKSLSAPTSSVTRTVYGVYPVYTNVGSSSNDAAADTKIVGTSKDQTEFTVTYKDDSTNKSMFVWPGDRTVTVQLWNPTFSTWGDVATANQATADTETVINNVTYKSWTYTGNPLGDGAKFKFTLGKKISE